MERRGVGFSLIAVLAILGAVFLPRLSSTPERQAENAPSRDKDDKKPEKIETVLKIPVYEDVTELLAEHFQVSLDATGKSLADVDTDALRQIYNHDDVRHSIVKVLIATVPDPVDSVETWQFDPDVDALRMAMGAMGYSLDRFRFPGVSSDADKEEIERHRYAPGVVVFSREKETPSKDSPEDVLVLFLIPETPTAGIHFEPFRRAAGFVRRWHAIAKSWPLVGIIGPSFSGSARSLSRAIERSTLNPPCGTKVRVISGSASNSTNLEIIRQNVPCAPAADATAASAGASSFNVTFESMVHPNEFVDAAVGRFMEDSGLSGVGSRTALLYEGSTPFGDDLNKGVQGDCTAPKSPGSEKNIGRAAEKQELVRTCQEQLKRAGRPLRIEVPFNISKLRGAGGATGRRVQSLDTVLPNVRPLPLGDSVVQTDQLTVRMPETMSAYVELVLRNLIDALGRAKVRAVQISTTDVRDRLFLTRELSQRAPDIAIILTDGDLLISHPEQFSWTGRAIVASSYPLHTITQGATDAPKQFYNLPAQGIYNAAVLALGGDQRLVDYESVPASNQECPVDRLEYPEMGRPVNLPPVWISLVSRGEAWPIRKMPVCMRLKFDQDAALFDYMAPTPSGLPKREVRPQPSTATTALLMLVTVGGLLVGVIAYRARGERLTKGSSAVLLLLIAVAAAAQLLAASDVWWPLTAIVMIPVVFLVPALLTKGLPGGTRVFVLAVIALVTVAVAAAFADFGDDSLRRVLLLEVESGVSPFVPLLIAAALPLVVALVALRLQYLRGGWSSGTQWHDSTVKRVTTMLGAPLSGGWHGLTEIHDRLLVPSWRGWGLTLVAIGAGLSVMFWGAHRPFSPFGDPFMTAVTVAFLAAQAVLAVALVQFEIHRRGCADLLRRLARHSICPGFSEVPRPLMPTGVLPRRPRLYELQTVIDSLRACRAWPADVRDVLKSDLEQVPQRRWWATDTWKHILESADHVTTALKYDADAALTKKRRTALAMVSVVVIREVLAHLTLCLLLIGPMIAVQIALYSTVLAQSRHAVLALIWVNVATSVVVVIGAFLQMDRDETLSLISDTKPGQLEWSFDLISKVGVYGVLPLMTLFLSQFPGIGARIVEVIRSIPTTP